MKCNMKQQFKSCFLVVQQQWQEEEEDEDEEDEQDEEDEEEIVEQGVWEVREGWWAGQGSGGGSVGGIF